MENQKNGSGSAEQKTFRFEMKSKNECLREEKVLPNFSRDICLYADEREISVPSALGIFLKKENPTPYEMGRFAIELSIKRSFVEGSVILFKALGVTKENVAKDRFFEEYIGIVN